MYKHFLAYIKEYKILLIGTFFAIFLSLFIKPVVVKGVSMYPTYKDKDILLMKCNTFSKYSPKVNDIAVIELEPSYFLIKRIIGVPGDTIEIKNNQLFVNSKAITEKYIKEPMYCEDFKIKLRFDEFFAMGDNRNNSSDSRYYGPFKISSIKGIIIK